MTTLDDTMQWVIHHARDKAAALAAVDRFEEEKGVTPYQARRAIGRLRLAVRRAHALVLATRMLARGSKYVRLVQHLVHVAAELNDRRTHTIMIVTGFQRPILVTRGAARHRPRVRRGWIVVGARWVIAAVRQFLRQDAMLKKALDDHNRGWDNVSRKPIHVKARKLPPKTK